LLGKRPDIFALLFNIVSWLEKTIALPA